MSVAYLPPKEIAHHDSRWHTSDNYILPSDQAEAQRLEAQHQMLRDVYKGHIVLAPVTIPNGAEILDVGTGSGAWAMDFLYSYPNATQAQLLGIDIETRLFPQSPPANATFAKGSILDVPQEWNNRFTFVHQRLLIGALKADEWKKDIANIFRITAPGGWIQLTEAHIDADIFNGGPASLKGMGIYDSLASLVGLDIYATWRLEKVLEDAGYSDVEPIRVTVPIGAWNGEVSAKVARNMTRFFRSLKTPVLRNGGLGFVSSEAEYDKLMDDMEEEWKQPGTSIGWHSFIGRKPL